MCLGKRSKKKNPGAWDAAEALVVVKRRNKNIFKKNRSPSDSRFKRGRGTGMGEVVNLEWARWLIVSKVCKTNEVKHTWGSRCISSPSLHLRVLLLILNPILLLALVLFIFIAIWACRQYFTLPHQSDRIPSSPSSVRSESELSLSSVPVNASTK